MSNLELHPTFVEKYPWADFPILNAPSPDDRQANIKLQLAPEFIVGNLRKQNRTPIYQAWAHLVGCVPPVPNIQVLHQLGVAPTLTTLVDAHACYKGVERPIGDDMDGRQIYIYLLKAAVTIRFDNRPPVVVPAVHRLDDDLVFAVYVQRDDGLHRDGEALWGTVLKMELIETQSDDHSLPVDHESRYDERVW